MATLEKRMNELAEYIITHDPKISPELVGSKLADATQPIMSYLKGEQRRAVLTERADAIAWLKERAKELGVWEIADEVALSTTVTELEAEAPGGWTLYTMKRLSPIYIMTLDDLIANIKLDPRDVKQIYKGTSDINSILVYDHAQGIVLGSAPGDEYDKIKGALGFWTKEAAPGWEQRIRYQLGYIRPEQITASQEEYEKPAPPGYSGYWLDAAIRQIKAAIPDEVAAVKEYDEVIQSLKNAGVSEPTVNKVREIAKDEMDHYQTLRLIVSELQNLARR